MQIAQLAPVEFDLSGQLGGKIGRQLLAEGSTGGADHLSIGFYPGIGIAWAGADFKAFGALLQQVIRIGCWRVELVGVHATTPMAGSNSPRKRWRARNRLFLMVPSGWPVMLLISLMLFSSR